MMRLVVGELLHLLWEHKRLWLNRLGNLSEWLTFQHVAQGHQSRESVFSREAVNSWKLIDDHLCWVL